MEAGFVGLGKRGRPMVRRLLAAGHQVHVFNRSQEPVQEVAQLGALPAQSLAELARHAAVVLTALPTPDSVTAVYEELAGAASEGQVFVDHSTVSLGLNRRCAELLAGRQAGFLDAPVSGG